MFANKLQVTAIVDEEDATASVQEALEAAGYKIVTIEVTDYEDVGV